MPPMVRINLVDRQRTYSLNIPGLRIYKSSFYLLKIHLAGHSTGAVLLGHLLDALDVLDIPNLIESCNLMAPACSIDFYREHYEPRLQGKDNGKTKVRLLALSIYNLSKKLTKSPGLSIDYSKSGKKGVTVSTSHGGFDNDVKTMNTIMTQILKQAPAKPFTKDEMNGY